MTHRRPATIVLIALAATLFAPLSARAQELYKHVQAQAEIRAPNFIIPLTRHYMRPDGAVARTQVNMYADSTGPVAYTATFIPGEGSDGTTLTTGVGFGGPAMFSLSDFDAFPLLQDDPKQHYEGAILLNVTQGRFAFSGQNYVENTTLDNITTILWQDVGAYTPADATSAGTSTRLPLPVPDGATTSATITAACDATAFEANLVDGNGATKGQQVARTGFALGQSTRFSRTDLGIQTTEPLLLEVRVQSGCALVLGEIVYANGTAATIRPITPSSQAVLLPYDPGQNPSFTIDTLAGAATATWSQTDGEHDTTTLDAVPGTLTTYSLPTLWTFPAQLTQLLAVHLRGENLLAYGQNGQQYVRPRMPADDLQPGAKYELLGVSIDQGTGLTFHNPHDEPANVTADLYNGWFYNEHEGSQQYTIPPHTTLTVPNILTQLNPNVNPVPKRLEITLQGPAPSLTMACASPTITIEPTKIELPRVRRKVSRE